MTPKQELNAIMKKQEIVTATIAVDLMGELTNASPVGNPSLWEDPDSAPDGYTGGQLRRSWTIAKTNKYTWEINNNMQYAEHRLQPAYVNDKGVLISGSFQFPAGIQHIIDRYDRKLQSQLNKI